MGNTYSDMIGGHDALAISSAPSSADGKVGNAQSFNGTTNFLQVADHVDFDWSNDQGFSIEMYVKLTAIASDDNMIFIGRDESSGSVHWWIGAEKNTGKPIFTVIDSDNKFNEIKGASALVIGNWYHIVGVRDASTNETYLYVNNTKVGTGSVAYTGSFGAAASIDVGKLVYNGDTDRFYAPAVIDELAIYSKALSSAEIDMHSDNGVFNIGYCEDYSPYFLSIADTLAVVGEEFSYEAYATGAPVMSYSLVSGPGSINSSSGELSWTPGDVSQSGAAFTISATNSQGTATQSFKVYVAEEPSCPSGIQNMYKLNESFSPYLDFSGGNHAEAIGSPTASSGRFNGAQQFDGVDDGLNLADNGTYTFNKNASFSFEFWVKTPASPAKNMVCMGRQGTIFDGDTSKLHLWVGVLKSTGQVAFYARDAHGNEPEPDGMISGGAVADDYWHYVVAVRDAASRKNYIYVDGAEVAVSESYSYGNSFGTFDGDPFNVGYLLRENKTPAYFFNGSMDEVAIYTKALSSSEVANNYLMSLAEEWHCEPGNYAPIFTSDPITAALEAEEYVYNIEANDIDPDDNLTITGTTVPDWLTYTDLGDGNALLTGTPSNAHIGDHTVVLTVTDEKTPITQEYTLSVVNQNDPPLITSSPVLTVDEDATYSYTVVAEDQDVGDVLNYSATTIPSWLTFDSETHILSGIPKNDDVGDHDVVIQVADALLYDEQAFTIAVANVNDVPVIVSQQLISTNEDTPFIITVNDVSVVDVDNEAVDQTLVVENGLNYTFEGAMVTPAENFNGTLIVNLHANDLEGSGPSFGAEVTVLPVNDPPTITSEPIKDATVGELYGFVFTAIDVDGDDLVKSQIEIPSFLIFDPSTGILGGTPASSDIKDHIVALKVSDGIAEEVLSYTLSVNQWPVGVESENSMIQRVYPVPANEAITFEFNIKQEATLTVYDLTGKQLIQRMVEASESKIELDLTNMKEGLYMFRFKSGDETSIQTFVISR